MQKLESCIQRHQTAVVNVKYMCMIFLEKAKCSEEILIVL